MSQTTAVHEIAVLLLVALAGLLAQWSGRLDDASVSRLGRLVVDIALPALVFSQMVATTDRIALSKEAWLPALGALVVAVGLLVGAATRRVLGQSPTFAFVAGLPNWIYLPLPIATASYGASGTRAVLMMNIGATLALWTLGVATLQPSRGLSGFRNAIANPGVLAALAASGWIVAGTAIPLPGGVVRPGLAAVEIIGGLAIPATMLLTGAQTRGLRRPTRALLAAVVTRLLIAPLVTVLGLVALNAVGIALSRELQNIVCLIAAMPVAISAGAFAERFGGDGALASQATLYSTIASLVTVPVVLAAVEWIF